MKDRPTPTAEREELIRELKYVLWEGPLKRGIIPAIADFILSSYEPKASKQIAELEAQLRLLERIHSYGEIYIEDLRKDLYVSDLEAQLKKLREDE